MLPIGQIALVFRLLLYPLAGAIAGWGFATFDRTEGLLVIDVNAAATVLAGLAIWAATVVWSRIVKARGGAT